jgi:hypothetical protein
MFGPGGVLFLLSHEMLLTWRNFRATGKGRHVRRIIFYSIMIAALGFGGYWAARFLSGVTPQPDMMTLGIVGGVLAILFSLMRRFISAATSISCSRRRRRSGASLSSA